MASFDLEIKELSIESLVMPHKSKKKNTLFVSVKTDSNELESKWHSTSMVDTRKTETSVAWKERFKKVVSLYANHVVFELRVSRKSMFTGKSKCETICTARVPISDFVEGHTRKDCLRFMSYRLRDRDGDGIGIVNFSVRIEGLVHDGNFESGDRRWWHPHDTGGVVTGIPVAWCL